MSHLPKIQAYLSALLLWMLFLNAGGCGQHERDNPVDPEGADGSGDGEGIQLIASLPEGKIQPEHLFKFSYQVSALEGDGEVNVLVRGEMNLVGESARAQVLGVPPGVDRTFRVDAFDAANIRTFTASQTLEVGLLSPQVVLFQLERLQGELELIALLPPEIESLEVVVVADGDSLNKTFTADDTGVRRISDIPTGADIPIILRGRDAEEQVLIQHQVTADIRDDLLARVSLSVTAGALDVIAYFPEYLTLVSVDRFSDAAGTFFRRSDSPDLPGPGEPIDFDHERFLARGFGPDGESISFYNFDVRSNAPAPVYIPVDRRGDPIPGQLPIFDLLPGEEGYNDLWQIYQVDIPELDYKQNHLTSLQDVTDAGYEVVPTGEVMNCVMVPAGSSASLRFDPAMTVVPQDGWYRGQIVKYLLFENPNSTATVAFGTDKISTPQMFAFLENNRDLIDGFARDQDGLTHNVVSVLPGRLEADYSPLWLLRVLKLDAFEQVGNLASASLQTSEHSNEQITDLKINAPVVTTE